MRLMQCGYPQATRTVRVSPAVFAKVPHPDSQRLNALLRDPTIEIQFMTSFSAASLRISNTAGLTIELNTNGSLKRIDYDATIVNLYPGNELEGGPANIYLRRPGTTE